MKDETISLHNYVIEYTLNGVEKSITLYEIYRFYYHITSECKKKWSIQALKDFIETDVCEHIKRMVMDLTTTVVHNKSENK